MTHTTNTDDPICFPKPMLQELSDMATSYCDTLDVADQKIYRKIWERQFAELIVQECVNVLHDNELWSRDVSHALKEHFGVEE